jgi:hypothetical protein
MIGKLERKIEKAERKMFRRHFYARRSYYPPAPPPPPPPSYGGGYGSGGYGSGGYGAYPPISPMLPQERYNPAANLYGPMAGLRPLDRDGNGMITQDGMQICSFIFDSHIS